jgi:uncharacterized protein
MGPCGNLSRVRMVPTAPLLSCLRCGWVWLPRGSFVTICPQCKSRVSDVPPPLKLVGGGGLGVNEVVRPKLKELRTVLRAHKASNPRVFGPVARGSPRKDSDLDLLVDFQAGASVFDWGALSEDLTELFGRHVDVGTDASLWPSIRSQVLSEAVAV